MTVRVSQLWQIDVGSERATTLLKFRRLLERPQVIPQSQMDIILRITKIMFN